MHTLQPTHRIPVPPLPLNPSPPSHCQTTLTTSTTLALYPLVTVFLVSFSSTSFSLLLLSSSFISIPLSSSVLQALNRRAFIFLFCFCLLPTLLGTSTSCPSSSSTYSCANASFQYPSAHLVPVIFLHLLLSLLLHPLNYPTLSSSSSSLISPLFLIISPHIPFPAASPLSLLYCCCSTCLPHSVCTYVY